MTIKYNNSGNSLSNICSWAITDWDWDEERKKVESPNTYDELVPVRVIFNNKTCICFWKDGTKTVVTCQYGDVFSEKEGILQCIAKKVRREFEKKDKLMKRLIKNAYHQPNKDEVKK